jgi:CubicO group peptidase (beta-lactamase class C family)
MRYDLTSALFMQARPRTIVLALAATAVLLQPGVAAQNLALSLFERYLEPLRVQAGIPGMAVVIVQDGQVVWEKGLGYRDLEGLHPVYPDTPFPIGELTQTMTAGLLLNCAETGETMLHEPIGKWVPAAESPSTPLRHLITHAAPGTTAGFRYDPARFALLARPIEVCMEEPFRRVIAREVLERAGMLDAVPGYDIATVAPLWDDPFDETTLTRYVSILQRLAVPYKIDRRGRAARSQLPPAVVDGAHGIIASARDLAKFDKALDEFLLTRPSLQALSWTNAVQNGVITPVGMGWFVQTYQNEKVVWQFGHSPDSFSSLILKVPGRKLSLIVLANSDGLSAPYSLSDGDVTKSLFARTFLGLFL